MKFTFRQIGFWVAVLCLALAAVPVGAVDYVANELRRVEIEWRLRRLDAKMQEIDRRANVMLRRSPFVPSEELQRLLRETMEERDKRIFESTQNSVERRPASP